MQAPLMHILTNSRKKKAENISPAMLTRITRICRQDPDSFVNYILGYNAPETGPNKWYPPEEVRMTTNGEEVGMTCQMHYDWQKALDDHDKVYIEAPREHAKTNRVTIGRVIYAMGTNPDLRNKIVCQNDEKAAEIVTAIGQHILTNPRVKAVFPKLEPDQFGQWSRHKLTVKRSIISRDASLEASGILATGVGGRADILWLDDPVDFKNAIQFPAFRETVKKAYYGVWLNLLPSQGGRLCYICTPWHKMDLSMDIRMNHPEYFVVSRPILPDMKPRWFSKWGTKELEERLKAVGRREFDRGFALKPLSEEDQLFRPASFNDCYDTTLTLGKLPGNPTGWKFYTGVDLGIGRRVESPKTSIFTFGIKNNLRVPVEIKIAKYGEIQKLKEIEATYKKWQPEVIGVENNSYQESLLNLFKELNIRVPIRGIYTGVQKADLERGLPSMAVEVENKMWQIPVARHEFNEFGLKTETCGCPVCTWIDECVSYPIGLSDVLMSWWIAREAYSSIGGTGRSLVRFLNRDGISGRSASKKVDGWSADVLVGEDDD